LDCDSGLSPLLHHSWDVETTSALSEGLEEQDIESSQVGMLLNSRGSVLKGIEYNSSTKVKGESTSDVVTTGSRENCESENLNTEVENDKKVSFDNVTNVG